MCTCVCVGREVTDSAQLLIPPNLARDIQFTVTSRREVVMEIVSVVCEYGPHVAFHKTFKPAAAATAAAPSTAYVGACLLAWSFE